MGFHIADAFSAISAMPRGSRSRLPPYEDWAKLLIETKRIWTQYVERLAPQRVTRVATRFINNLRLPFGAR